MPNLSKKEAKMIRIGLTGGIASGKSLVSDFFKQENIVVLDADMIYKNLLYTNQVMRTKIIKEFSLDEINLKELAKKVFADPNELKKLNRISHPFVIRAFKEQLTRYKATEKFIVLDIPLLFEANMEDFCDYIICVYTTEEVQLKRLIERNDLSVEAAKKRIESQWPLKDKCEKSDYVIDNSFEKSFTKEQFIDIFKKIKEDKNVN